MSGDGATAWRQRAEEAVFGAVLVFVITMSITMNTGGFVYRGPDATLGCTYDSDQNRLGVSVVSGGLGQAETTAVWVVDRDGPVELRNGGEAVRNCTTA